MLDGRVDEYELCVAGVRSAGKGSILGAQRMGSLWRLYPKSLSARASLVAKGLSIAGRNVEVSSQNPYLVRGTDGVEIPSTRLTISDVGILFPYQSVETALIKMGLKLRSKITMEEVRDREGRRTEWLSGRRFVWIDLPKTSIETEIEMGPFKAKLYYREMKAERVCRKCQQKGHLVAQCPNREVCFKCKREGHRARNCPNRMAWNGEERLTMVNDLTEELFVGSDANPFGLSLAEQNTEVNDLNNEFLDEDVTDDNLSVYQEETNDQSATEASQEPWTVVRRPRRKWNKQQSQGYVNHSQRVYKEQVTQDQDSEKEWNSEEEEEKMREKGVEGNDIDEDGKDDDEDDIEKEESEMRRELREAEKLRRKQQENLLSIWGIVDGIPCSGTVADASKKLEKGEKNATTGRKTPNNQEKKLAEESILGIPRSRSLVDITEVNKGDSPNEMRDVPVTRSRSQSLAGGSELGHHPKGNRQGAGSILHYIAMVKASKGKRKTPDTPSTENESPAQRQKDNETDSACDSTSISTKL